jgi:alpha-tubulin suppressor-like RCC1 family protein
LYSGGVPLTDVVALASGYWHNVAALRNTGTVWCWGYNASVGLCGDGTMTYTKPSPTQVIKADNTPLTHIKSLAAAGWHTLALGDGTDPRVYTWGENTNGVLGSLDLNHRVKADLVKLPGGAALTNVAAIATGWDHGLAVKTDGTVWAWGGNYYGQLGTGNNTDSLGAVQVLDTDGQSFLSNVVEVAAGTGYSLARKSNGCLMAWGRNNPGCLGTGNSVQYWTPTPVASPLGCTPATRPGNDECISEMIDCGDTLSGNLVAGASPSAVPVPPGAAPMRDVWYQVRDPHGHGWGLNVYLWTGSADPSYIAVYTGTCGSLSLKAYCTSMSAWGRYAAYYMPEDGEDVYIRLGSKGSYQSLELSCFNKLN